MKSSGYTDPCQEICGQSSCAEAKDPGTCDLTKQLPGFTGDKDLKLNGEFHFFNINNFDTFQFDTL